MTTHHKEVYVEGICAGPPDTFQSQKDDNNENGEGNDIDGNNANGDNDQILTGANYVNRNFRIVETIGSVEK